MKLFFRFWFTPTPISQATPMYVYSADAQTALNRVKLRLEREYPAGSLNGRMEQFTLEDSGQFGRAGTNLQQLLTPADVFAVCQDMERMPPGSFDLPTQRLVDLFHSHAADLERSLLPANTPAKRKAFREQMIASAR